MNKEQFMTASILRKEIVDLEKQQEAILKALDIDRSKFYAVYKYDRFYSFYERYLEVSFELSRKILKTVLKEIESELKEKNEQFNKL